jgi:hypothetical protein
MPQFRSNVALSAVIVSKDTPGHKCLQLFLGVNGWLDNHLGVPVLHTDQMREHASRLLAMALTARDKGQIEYADRLTKQASDVLDAAKAVETARHSQPKYE